jgi:LacI family transcriptional regulator
VAKTIQDVATLAGVGVGTVSRVLNNHPSVRPETRARIEAAMEELGYTPNPHARRVAGGRSYSVAVILPVIATEFYTRLLDGLERVFSENRYDTALFPILNEERLVRYLSSNALAFQADGVVLATHNISELYPDRRLPTRHPVVLVDAFTCDGDCAYLDNVLGGRMVGDLVARLDGEYHVLTVEQPLDRAFTSTVFADRLRGFTEALQASGRDAGSVQVHSIAFNQDAARAAFANLVKESGLPVNVFAPADYLAEGVLLECERLGLRPGCDVRLVGFDDHPWAERRGLTTVRQPVEAMGEAAATLLLERLSGQQGAPRQVRFAPLLVERASTAASS